MKKLLFIFVISLATLPAICQVDSTIKAQVTVLAQAMFKSWAAGILTDTVIWAYRADAVIINADTLNLPQSSAAIFTIQLMTCNPAEVNPDFGWAVKTFAIKRAPNGVYFIYSGKAPDPNPYSGEATLAKATWGINLVGGLPVVQFQGTNGIGIFWLARISSSPILTLK